MTRIDEYVRILNANTVRTPESKLFFAMFRLAAKVGDIHDELLPHPGVRVAKSRWVWEMGHVLHAVVDLALDFGFNPHDLTDILTGGLRCETFEDLRFQRLTPHDTRGPFLKMTVAMGQLAEVVQFAFMQGRDLAAAKRAVAVTSLATILGALCELCDKYKLNIEEIVRTNVRNLTNPKPSDRIQGEG
jgi:hypothetical protein